MYGIQSPFSDNSPGADGLRCIKDTNLLHVCFRSSTCEVVGHLTLYSSEPLPPVHLRVVI